MEGERRLLLAFCLAIVCGVGVMSYSCEPDCGGMSAGTMVPDPLNCSQFYVCSAEEYSYPIPCEPGYEFPQGASSCQPIGTEPCVALCDKSHCRYACNTSIPLDVVASRTNCSHYHICLPDAPETQECPPDFPVFDGETCVTDKSKCCDYACTPYCSPGQVLIIDPEDCHSYYICLEEGPADETYHYTCEAGEHFDLQNGHCVSGGECTNLCEGGSVITPAEPTPTTTPEPTTTQDCVASYVCPDNGYYARCHSCTPDYFLCSGSGNTGVIQSCSGGLVFNPDPDYPYCVLPENCPYHPTL